MIERTFHLCLSDMLGNFTPSLLCIFCTFCEGWRGILGPDIVRKLVDCPKSKADGTIYSGLRMFFMVFVDRASNS